MTRLHMLICCTCGSCIGGLWWSELPPTHFHPILFILTECGPPFTLLSQRRKGEGAGVEKEGRAGGGGTLVSEGERWSFSSSWLREKEKQLVCKWMPLPYSWMTHATTPSPPSLHPSSPSSPPSLLSAVPGCFERGTLWRRGLLAEHLCKI